MPLNLVACWISKIGYITGPYFDKFRVLVSPNMPAPAPALPPIAYQVAAISINLNSTMFFTFLMGLCLPTSHFHWHILIFSKGFIQPSNLAVCTSMASVFTTMNSIFFNDLMVIVTRKGSQATIVTATITMLYLLSIAQLAIAWQQLQSNFVDSGETCETIFIYWAELASAGFNAVTNILPDGLLVSTTFTISFRFSHLKLGKIWRCFHMWNRSLRTISLPFFFLVAETGEISFERTRNPN